jgi:phosphoglycerate dehydrogenase-like enzyme
MIVLAPGCALAFVSRRHYVLHMMKILFLTGSHLNPTSEELARVKERYPNVQIATMPMKDYDLEALKEAEIIAGIPKPGDLRHAAKLKWLQTQSAGVEKVARRELFANDDVIVTSASGTYGRQISDHVMGMVLGFNHNLFIYRDQMNEKRWQSYFPETDLWNQTMIIIGFGDLGRNIARKANAFGIHTIVFRRTMSEKPEYVDELYPIDLLDEHIHRADYLVLAPAATAETLSILNRGRLFAMKKGAYVINVSRGTLLDEEALIDALKSGHLGGAGLDVTTVEPLDPSSELWGMKNVLITPHASGLAPHSIHTVFEIFFENLGHYLTDRSRMKNVVDFTRGY